MAEFIYGTGEKAYTLSTGSDDVVASLCLFTSKLRDSGVDSFDIEIRDGHDVRVLLVTPGVPLQFHYDTSELGEQSSDLVEAFDRSYKETGRVIVTDAPGYPMMFF